MVPPQGGGGTDFRPALRLARKMKVDAILYATDTYGSFLDQKELGQLANRTIWLTFGQEKVNVPYGKHINIDPNSVK